MLRALHAKKKNNDWSLKMWDYQNKKMVGSLIRDREITSFSFLSNGELFCLGNMDGKLEICDLQSMATQIEFNHSEKITCITSCPNNTKLFASSSYKCIRVWSIEKSKEIHIAEKKMQNDVYSIHFEENKIFFRDSIEISFWDYNLNTITKISSYNTDSSLNFLMKKFKNFILWEGKQILQLYDEEKCGNFPALGKHDLENILDITFNSNGFKFASSGKDNKIRIWDNEDGINSLIQYYLNNPITPTVEMIIMIMTKFQLHCDFENPYKLMEYFFNIVKSPCLFYKLEDNSRKFLTACIEKDKVTQVCQNDFLQSAKETNKITESRIFGLRFLNIKDILQISTESVQLLDRFAEFDLENNIYQSSALKCLVDFKWNQFGNSIFLQNLLSYLCFMMIFTINALFFFPMINKNDYSCVFNILYFLFSGISIIFSFVLIYFEVKQYKALGRRKHFKSIWNILDGAVLIMTPSCLIIGISAMQNTELTELVQFIHAFNFFLVWMRSFDFCRGFEQTALYVIIIFQVIENIRFFIVFLFLFIFIFSCFFYILTIDKNNGLVHALKLFYKLILGDFDDFNLDYDSYVMSILIWILFFCATLLLLIILLNLLISIISDCHEDIKEKIDKINLREKIKFLSDYQSLILRDTQTLKKLNDQTENKFLIAAFKNKKIIENIKIQNEPAEFIPPSELRKLEKLKNEKVYKLPELIMIEENLAESKYDFE